MGDSWQLETPWASASWSLISLKAPMSINIPSMFTTPKEFWQEPMKIDEKQCIEMDEGDEENVARDDQNWIIKLNEAKHRLKQKWWWWWWCCCWWQIVAREVGGFWAAKLGSEWEFNSGYWAPKGWTQIMDLLTIVPKSVAHLNSTMSRQILQI